MEADRTVRRLLLLTDDRQLAGRVTDLLGAAHAGNWRVAHLSHLQDALVHLSVGTVDLVLAGPTPADVDLPTALRKLSAAGPEVPVIALLKGRGTAGRQEARKAGAVECLDIDDLNADLWSRTLRYCRREVEVNRELARITARLDWLTHQDALTDLLNRKGLERVMSDELAACRRARRDLMVVLVDLDDFARINATLGHGVGDLVLVSAARRIIEAVGDGAKVGRCGTDRFVVVLPGADMKDGETVAEKIRLGISRDVMRAGDHTLTTTASLAVTAIAPDALSFDEVLAKAQFVLERGRQKGSNQVTRGVGPDEVPRIETVEAGPETIRAILRGDVLEVVSQPIVNLVDGRIVSREMLIRGPEGPLRRPDDLFRFCQERDILQALDLRCVKMCAEAARRDGGGRYHVNILPATLLQTPVPELVRVLRNGVKGHCCLEISEQQLLGDPSVLTGPVRELQDAGIDIAIDDVGFGNSCLEGLVMLQPQVMKIDKRMVSGLADDPDLRRSLNRLLLVGEVLGAEVVAEGVETTDDYRVLLDLGVRLGQGYLFGKPTPVVERPPAGRRGASDHPDEQPDAAGAEA